MQVSREKMVSFNFIIKDEAGNQLDSSEGEPTRYIHGLGAVLPIIEQNLEGKEVGFKTEFMVTADEAFGLYREELVISVPLSEFEDEELAVGMEFSADEEGDDNFVWRVTQLTDDEVTLDANHPFAGKNLWFIIELVEVREATTEELAGIGN